MVTKNPIDECVSRVGYGCWKVHHATGESAGTSNCLEPYGKITKRT